MIIDFHTHTFPDSIAEKTIEYLSKTGGITPHRDGTVGSLIKSMKNSGIDYCVSLPVATNPKQERTINRTSVESNGKNNIFFSGAIHPDCADVDSTLDYIKDSGLFGIKLHPDYQGVEFDDPRYINIMRKAFERGLYVITHAGFDPAFPDHIHCTPDMVLKVLDELKGLCEHKLILAHLGGCFRPDEVLQKLIGAPVYMDTAAMLDYSPEKAKLIIEKHGADNILFATDSPWFSQKEYVEIFRSFGFSRDDEDKMFYKNAVKILKM